MEDGVFHHRLDGQYRQGEIHIRHMIHHVEPLPQLGLVDIRIGPHRPEFLLKGAHAPSRRGGVQGKAQVAGKIPGHFIGFLRPQDDKGLKGIEGMVKEMGADLA